MLAHLLLLLQSPTQAPVQPPVASPPAPGAQEGAPAPQQGPASAPEVLNGIYLAVNEEVVTLADFYRELRRRGLSVTDEAERRRVFQENHADFVRQKLMTQAGRDLGFDPERVKSLVDDDLKGFIEDSGSVSSFGAALKGANLDAESFREQRQDFYYRELWQRSIDGRDPGVGGRPYVDRFVRPGRLLFQFRRQPADQLFPSRIQLQELLIGAPQAGSGQKALELCTALRERALAGEDFGKLAEQYSADPESRRRSGLLPLVELSRAREALPELVEFLDAASAGSISEPLPRRIENELVGFLLVRVHTLERREAPEFADREVQRLLRDRDVGRVSEFRRDLGLSQLYRAAYVWPPEARGQPTPAAAKPAAGSASAAP